MLSTTNNNQTFTMTSKNALLDQMIQKCRQMNKSTRIYSSTEMQSGGFYYTDDEDTARCNTCGLELSNWNRDLKPYDRHARENPYCPYVRSLSSTSIVETDESKNNVLFKPFSEVKSIMEVRKRTFSHWSSQDTPSAIQMIQAGFFYCNINDRVLCLYCNLICQDWKSTYDHPLEVHRTLSPQCPYVKQFENQASAASIPIVNETRMNDHLTESKTNNIVATTAYHSQYIEINQREASFSTWPKENLPSVDSLVRAGFYYSGQKSIATCFYCNNSLQNWGPNDDPIIEHARWFPDCRYIRQLCDPDLFKRIQAAQVDQQEKDSRPSKFDDETLRRLVAARLDLDVSKRILDENFTLTIVKRCWLDQLKLKGEDFASDIDLFIACTILDKQIKYINGEKENVVVPRIAMENYRDGRPIKLRSAIQTQIDTPATTLSPIETTSTSKIPETQANPCVICLAGEKQVACIPCGHLIACVPCGHSLLVCALCRAPITSLVRVYL